MRHMFIFMTQLTKHVHRDRSDGFTLIETLVVITVGAMIALFVTTIAVDVLRSTSEIRQSNRLHADVMHVTSQLSYTIKQSAVIESDDGSSIVLFMPDLTRKEITFDTALSEILIDGSPATGENLEVLDFSVEPAENSVRLRFTVSYVGSEREYEFVTTLARRNIL